MTIYEKLGNAKQQIANTEMKKAGKNSFSNYEYFTPEQVSILVQKACDTCGLLTLFSLKRNEYGEYWVLRVVDVETWDFIEVEWATAIPEIKATNVAQQIWGCMTYTERYLKMSLFWIVNNDLDFDTTENTKKNSWWTKFTDTVFKNFEKVKDKYKSWDEAIAEIKTKYVIDQLWEERVRALYSN